MPVDVVLFLVLVVASPLLILLGHYFRERLTFAPFYGIATVTVLTLWQIRQLGWWLEWRDFVIDGAFVGLIPALSVGLLVTYALDGLRSARAFTTALLFAAVIGWGFAEFREVLAEHSPIPYAFELSPRSNLAALVGLLGAALAITLFYEGVRHLPTVLSFPAAVLSGNLTFLVLFAVVEYGANGVVLVQRQLPEFLLFSIPSLLMVGIYGLLLRDRRSLMPPRPFSEVVSIWRSTESNLGSARQDALEARQTASELRRLNQALTANARITEHQLQNSAYGILLVGRRGLVDKVNPAARRLFGDTADLVGQRLVHLVRSERGLELGKLAATADRQDVEITNGDGEQLVCELSVMRNFTEDGAPRGYFLSFKDVTDDRRSSRFQRIEAKVQELHQAGRILSHDFTNLFLGMEGALANIQRAGPGQDATFDEAWSSLCRGVRRGRDMLRQIGGADGVGRPRMRDLSVVAVANEAISVASAYAENKNIRLDRGEISPAFVRGDSTQLSRVLTNLLRNAARAAPVDGWIGLSAEVDDGWVRIRVADDGPGMAPEDLARATEPGFSSKGRGQGGLGLAIAYLMVEAHGGSLTLRNREPHGLEAEVALPVTSTEGFAWLAGALVVVFGGDPTASAIVRQLQDLDAAEVLQVFDAKELAAVLDDLDVDLLIYPGVPRGGVALDDNTALIDRIAGEVIAEGRLRQDGLLSLIELLPGWEGGG